MVDVFANASSIAKAACAAGGFAVLAAGVGSTSGAATPPPRGLTATVSGAAFTSSPAGSEMPVMAVHGLSAGRGTSGTVTVRNPTGRTRLFWLSEADVSDRIGPAGGRLSDSLQLSVLDVSTLSSPAAVYRGPATGIGARPLGFLAPGATRTYSFTASLPNSQGPPSAPGTNPYRGSSTALTFAWRAIEGSPARAPATLAARPPAAARPRRDSRPPSVRVSVPKRQPLLEDRALDFSVSCDEWCRQSVDGVVSAGTRRWKVPVVARSKNGHRQSLRLTFTPAAYAAVRSELISGRDASVSLSIRARDRAGNRTVRHHSIRLQGR